MMAFIDYKKKNRKKRNQLARLIRRFRQGAEALPDGVIVLKNDFTIIWCNKLSRVFFGLKWPEDNQQNLRNLLRYPEFNTYTQQENYSQPLLIYSPMNAEQVLEVRIMPYAEDQLLLIARDVTQLKQLEQMRRDFVANVSHELRTPLTVLSGYLEMFGDAAPSDDIWPKAHRMMEEQSKRMDTLINQLLVLSRIESGKRHSFEEKVNVPEMLHLIHSEAEALNKEYHHQLEFHIDDGLEVYGTADELRSAFSNLIFNAIYYTPEQGLVQVYWEMQGEEACFYVKDNGDGISTEHIHRLTERFYRVDRARSRSTGGSGLGLSIVKHVLSRHQSSLQIESQVGHGSCFRFALPEGLVVKEKEEQAFIAE